jgi:hypothetical protein
VYLVLARSPLPDLIRRPQGGIPARARLPGAALARLGSANRGAPFGETYREYRVRIAKAVYFVGKDLTLT